MRLSKGDKCGRGTGKSTGRSLNTKESRGGNGQQDNGRTDTATPPAEDGPPRATVRLESSRTRSPGLKLLPILPAIPLWTCHVAFPWSELPP